MRQRKFSKRQLVGSKRTKISGISLGKYDLLVIMDTKVARNFINYKLADDSMKNCKIVKRKFRICNL